MPWEPTNAPGREVAVTVAFLGHMSFTLEHSGYGGRIPSTAPAVCSGPTSAFGGSALRLLLIKPLSAAVVWQQGWWERLEQSLTSSTLKQMEKSLQPFPLSRPSEHQRFHLGRLASPGRTSIPEAAGSTQPPWGCRAASSLGPTASSSCLHETPLKPFTLSSTSEMVLGRHLPRLPTF